MIEHLDKIVTLSIFVPCDENGKPLIRPHNHEKWLHYEKEGFELFFGNEAENEAYHKAQKTVIFEGWQVHSGKVIIHNKSGNRIAFYSNGDIYFDEAMSVKLESEMLYYNHFLGTNPTLSDLAAATTDNPLKLK